MNEWVEGLGKATGMDEHSRQLIHVPILHSPADMGTVQEGLEAVYVEQFGRRRWQEHLALIDGFWEAVRAELEGMDMDWRRVDLYQDGLPVCGKELDIARETASKGSENYQLLMGLVGRGATLIGTEDTKLLVAEYRAVKAGLAAGLSREGSANAAADQERSADLLARRDAYIGRRIAETLLPGHTGILFLGMMHDVKPHLPADIIVVRAHLDVTGSEDGA